MRTKEQIHSDLRDIAYASKHKLQKDDAVVRRLHSRRLLRKTKTGHTLNAKGSALLRKYAVELYTVVVILRCKKHHFSAIEVDGLRITPYKCCGSWDVVREFTLLRSDIITAVQHKQNKR